MAVRGTPQMDGAKHWNSHLAGLAPCMFPRFGAENTGPRRPMTIRIYLNHLRELQELSAKRGTALPGVLRAVWALVLRCYTGSEDVCFGYQETGTNSATGKPGIGQRFEHMPVGRLNLEDEASLADVVEKSEREYIESVPYLRDVPPASIESVSPGENQLFNTVLMLRNYTNIGTTNRNASIPRPLNMVLPEDVSTSRAKNTKKGGLPN